MTTSAEYTDGHSATVSTLPPPEEPESTAPPEPTEDPEPTASPPSGEADEPPASVTPSYVMVDDTSAVVYDFAQLVEAIEKDNGIRNVHLGADITMLRNRVVISSAKSEFKLSGYDPFTGQRHTITEFATHALANIVLANGNATTRMVTLENLDIISQGSYYGLLGVEDSVRGVDYYVRNVHYTGRQFLYNLYGHVYFEGDNHIVINASTNGAGGQEVGEILQITVSGSLRIDHYATYPLFRMNYGASNITVGGSLWINAPNLSASGVFQSSADANALVIDVLPGASMEVTAGSRLIDPLGNSLRVGGGARFIYQKNGGLAGEAYAAIRLRQRLTVDSGAVFEARQAAVGASHLVSFYYVPSGQSGGVMEFNDPERVVLRNEGSTAMVYGVKTEELHVSAQYFEYWSNAESPLHAFDRSSTEEGADISLLLRHTGGVPKSLESNLPGVTADMLPLDKRAYMLVFGREEEAPPSQSFLRYRGIIEASGEEAPGFLMEDAVAEKGVEFAARPPTIAGYVLAGFSVDAGDILPMDAEGYARWIPQGDAELITFYYAEPLVSVSVPIKMLFAAYEGDGGAVRSPAMRFTNHSELPIRVELLGADALNDAAQSLPLITPEEASGTESLWIYIQPRDSERFQSASVLSNAQSSPLGILSARGDAEKSFMEFTLEGRYYGAFTRSARWPAYGLAFAFTIAT